MEIGAPKIILDFYGNDSAARKKSLLKDLMADLQRKYSVVAKEVEDFADPERGVIGLTTLGSTTDQVKSQLRAILDYIDDNSPARVIAEFVNVRPFDELERSF